MRSKWAKTTLSVVLLLSLLAAFGVARCGGGDTPQETEFTLKLSHASPEADSLGMQAQEFADLVEQYTDGRVKVEVYHSGMLYAAGTEWEALTTGSVDIVPRYSWYMLNTLPCMLAMSLSDVWEGYEHALNFYTSPELTAIIEAALEPVGVHYLASTPAYMTAVWANSVKEVEHTTDMQGLRRAKGPGTPDVPRDSFSGIITVEVPREDMVTALQTGVANLQTSYVSTCVATKVWEVTPHGFVVPSGPMAGVFMMNQETWNSLPADIQAIITDEVMPEVVQYSYDLMIASENEGLVTLLANMDSLNTESEADREALWEAIKDSPGVQGLIGMMGSEVWDLLEAARPSAG